MILSPRMYVFNGLVTIVKWFGFCLSRRVCLIKIPGRDGGGLNKKEERKDSQTPVW